MVFVDHLWPHSEFLCLKLFLESGEFQVQGLEGILELKTQKKKKINSLQYTKDTLKTVHIQFNVFVPAAPSYLEGCRHYIMIGNGVGP